MSVKTATQKLQEAVIAMDLEQLEQFNEKTGGRKLQDWELANIAETILGPRSTITEVARSNKGEAINESSRNGGSKTKTSEQLIEVFREQQFKAYRACGMSEAEASSAANFKPKKP